MSNIVEQFNKSQLRKGLPDIRPGDTVRIHQIIPAISGVKSKKTKSAEKDKEKIQVFEGLVLARKHGKGINATITVRKIIAGIGVEKILPINSPLIQKIEITKRGKVRRAKLFYLREAKGRKARLKRKGLPDVTATPAAPEGSEPRPEESGLEPKIEPESKPEPEQKVEGKETEKKPAVAETTESNEEKIEEKKSVSSETPTDKENK